MSDIYIIEGADGTGKSTLAQTLINRMGGTLLHFGKPFGHPLDAYVSRVGRHLGEPDPVVLDRSFIGSRIWARVGLHPHVLTGAQWQWICAWYASENAVTTIMVRPTQEMTEVILSRDEGDQRVYEAILGQGEYFQMAMNHEILYMPVSISTSAFIAEATGR